MIRNPGLVAILLVLIVMILSWLIIHSDWEPMTVILFLVLGIGGGIGLSRIGSK